MNKDDRFHVVTNIDVTSELFDKLIKIENEVFGEKCIDPAYFRSLHAAHNDDLFAVIDNNTNEPIGYFEALFLTEEQKETYLKDYDYRKLVNIGAQIGNNIMYIFSLALKKEYRGTNAIKMLAQSFATWLYHIRRQGKILDFVFGEAIYHDGVRSLTKSMGMIPVDVTELDAEGLGFYFSPDCLSSYIYKHMQQD